MNRLKDKRALITGGTSGIGLETARRFLDEGARVAVTGKNPATLEAARKELGGKVLIIPSHAGAVEAQAEVPRPKARDGELVVRVHAAGVTPTELSWYPTVVFDAVGGDTLRRSWGVLGRNGRLVTIASDSEADSLAAGRIDFVKSLGADETLDYSSSPFESP